MVFGGFCNFILDEMKSYDNNLRGNKMNCKSKICCLIILQLFILVFVVSCSPIDKKQVSEPVIRILNDNFFLQEAIDLAHNYNDRKKAKAYFAARKNFSFLDSRQQEQVILDNYIPQEKKNIMGVSVYFYDQQEKLVRVVVSVSPTAYGQIYELIDKSLDSVDVTAYEPSTATKLYFLGLYPLEDARILKIFIRKMNMPEVPMYAYTIEYGISET